MRAVPMLAVLVIALSGCSTLSSRFAPADTDRGAGDDTASDDEDTQDTFGGPDLGETALTDDPDTAVSELCGNGRIDPGEFCEDTDLQGETCESVGFAAGDLACGSNCRLDTTSCLDTPPGGTFCDPTQRTISSSGYPVVEGPVNVTTTGTVQEVEVAIQGYHDWIGDLDFYVSHGGVEVLLSQPDPLSGNCDSEGTIDVSFDDDALPGSSACDGANNYLGARIPLNPLSAFDGQDMSGLWTLRVEDLANNDGGAITNWCVTINPTP